MTPTYLFVRGTVRATFLCLVLAFMVALVWGSVFALCGWLNGLLP